MLKYSAMVENERRHENEKSPRILVSDELYSESCPYRVHVYPDGVSDLLRAVGFIDEEIGDLTIHLQKEARFTHKAVGEGQRIGGRYIDDNIIVYTEPIWEAQKAIVKAYSKYSSDYSVISPKRKKSNHPARKHGGLVSQKRLVEYLPQISEERAGELIQRLAMINANRRMNGVLAHEASHANDDLDGTVSERGGSVKGKKFLKKYALPAAAAPIIGFGISGAINTYSGKELQFDVGDLFVVSSAFAVIMGYGLWKNRKEWYKDSYLMTPTEARAYEFQKESDGRFKALELVPKNNI